MALEGQSLQWWACHGNRQQACHPDQESEISHLELQARESKLEIALNPQNLPLVTYFLQQVPTPKPSQSNWGTSVQMYEASGNILTQTLTCLRY